MAGELFRVLSLDGGGAKGFYTLGILREIEGLIGCPLHERFDLIFGTSTGSIIGAMLSLGKSVKEIIDIYTKEGLNKSLALWSDWIGEASRRLG
jgi:patatin-like phospholipase/acyl hydrolase